MRSLAVGTLLLALVGCAPTATPKTEPQVHPIIGRWVLDPSVAPPGIRVELEFKPDGSRRSLKQWSAGGELYEDHDRFVVRGAMVFVVSDGVEERLHYEIRDDRLVLRDPAIPGDMVFVRAD